MAAIPLWVRMPQTKHSLSYPWVLRELDQYRMWYGSTVTWDAGNGEMLHVINHATSVNGHELESTRVGRSLRNRGGSGVFAPYSGR